MQVHQPRESKGTQICNYNSRLEIMEDSLPLSHVEVDRRALSSIHTTINNKSGLTLPYQQEFHVSSVISCHVMSFHMPHHIVDDVNYISKMYSKVEVQRTCMEFENS